MAKTCKSAEAAALVATAALLLALLGERPALAREQGTEQERKACMPDVQRIHPKPRTDNRLPSAEREYSQSGLPRGDGWCCATVTTRGNSIAFSVLALRRVAPSALHAPPAASDCPLADRSGRSPR